MNRQPHEAARRGHFRFLVQGERQIYVDGQKIGSFDQKSVFSLPKDREWHIERVEHDNPKGGCIPVQKISGQLLLRTITFRVETPPSKRGLLSCPTNDPISHRLCARQSRSDPDRGGSIAGLGRRFISQSAG